MKTKTHVTDLGDGWIMTHRTSWENTSVDFGRGPKKRARESALEKLIEEHREEYDIYFDAYLIAEELKSHGTPAEPQFDTIGMAMSDRSSGMTSK